MNINMKYGKTGLSLDLPGDIDVTPDPKRNHASPQGPGGSYQGSFLRIR